MIQQDFDFKPNFAISPEIGDVLDTGHGFYQVRMKDENTGIVLEILGHSHSREDVEAFWNGLQAKTETHNLNPVSKHLANFAYWLQYRYMKLKSWITMIKPNLRHFLGFIAVLLVVSCTNQSKIEPKEKLDTLRIADSVETVNETGMCFDAHEEDGTLVVDSLKEATILHSTPISLAIKPCVGFNGVWHSHPNQVSLSEADVEYLERHHIEYSMVSVAGHFGAWHEDDVEMAEHQLYPEFEYKFNR